MKTGKNLLNHLVDEERVEPEDVVDFILADPKWLIMGISKEKLVKLISLLENNKERAGVWLK